MHDFIRHPLSTTLRTLHSAELVAEGAAARSRKVSQQLRAVRVGHQSGSFSHVLPSETRDYTSK